jgi:Uracil DNA glycosylase superfamily
MARAFDPGYASEPFRSLVLDAPGTQVYPQDDFRIEWGPIFHRGRLDGTARVLLIGQDPAQHETILRRILVGEAGHRIQGFLFKLGVERSYVMVNTYLYSVFGQGGGNRHKLNKSIARYRNRWLKAILDTSPVEAVVTLGSLAANAWQMFLDTPEGAGAQNLKLAKIRHPTQPEAAGGSAAAHAAAIRALLENWNDALEALHPLQNPDKARQLRRYGEAFREDEKREIPDFDAPPWAPEWMRLNDGWADRPGTGKTKRRSILVQVPSEFVP